MHIRRKKVLWEPPKRESLSRVVRKKRRVPLPSATYREVDDDTPQIKYGSIAVQDEKDEEVVWLLMMGDWIS
ncbi:hypothetical protein TorRG33x02_129930 [Trema orientale]|uniref:Uncharacterized protein n=1 Tax=Trema orientale TaxID=63057 RepID=A0A2P5F063_TREOI|nr:hypothetical protein TorRG33x02_129930 [Trema orientale]